MMVYNNIQILTGFEDNSSFVCPKDESVVRSRRLRATDLFECQTKQLLFEKPLCNCFIINIIYQNFLIQYTCPPSPRIWTRPRRINKMIMVLIHHIVVYSVIFCIIITIKDAFYSRCRCRYNKHSAILTYISLKKKGMSRYS